MALEKVGHSGCCRDIYADDGKALETWLPTEKPIYVEIIARSMSGRRFLRGSAV